MIKELYIIFDTLDYDRNYQNYEIYINFDDALKELEDKHCYIITYVYDSKLKRYVYKNKVIK